MRDASEAWPRASVARQCATLAGARLSRRLRGWCRRETRRPARRSQFESRGPGSPPNRRSVPTRRHPSGRSRTICVRRSRIVRARTSRTTTATASSAIEVAINPPARSVDADHVNEVGRKCSSNPRDCGRISAASGAMTPRPNDSTARPLLRCRYARLTRTDGREGAASSACSGRLSLGRRRRPSSGVRTDRTPRLVSSPRPTRVRGFGRSDTEARGATTHQLIDTLRENLKEARLEGLVAVGRGRPGGSQLGSQFILTSPLHAVQSAESEVTHDQEHRAFTRAEPLRLPSHEPSLVDHSAQPSGAGCRCATAWAGRKRRHGSARAVAGRRLITPVRGCYRWLRCRKRRRRCVSSGLKRLAWQRYLP